MRERSLWGGGGQQKHESNNKAVGPFPKCLSPFTMLRAVGWSVDVYSFEPGVLIFIYMLFFVFGQIRVIEYTGDRLTYRV